MVTYRFLRYGHRDAVQLDSVGRAFYAALCDVEYNDAYPVAIEQDGAVLYDEDAIRGHLERIYADYYEGRKGIHEVGARAPMLLARGIDIVRPFAPPTLVDPPSA